MNALLHFGLGIGWRPELAWAINRRSDLGFVEIVAEDFDGPGPLPAPIEQLRQRGVTILPHGIGLSLGSAEPPASERLAALACLAEKAKAPLVTEHLAFVRGGGLETGHLLPLPRTREALDIVVANIRRAQEALPVPLGLENVASLVEWPDDEMTEADFLAEVLERTDTLLLLDVENVYANARNHGWEPETFFDRIPLERIAYVHIAGGVEQQGLYHDTHTYPVPRPVFDLLEELCSRKAVPGVMLERDGRYPSEPELNAELDAIQLAVQRGAKRREASHVPC